MNEPTDQLNEAVGRWLLSGILPDMPSLPFDVRFDLSKLVASGPPVFEPVWRTHESDLRARADAWGLKPPCRRRDGSTAWWCEVEVEQWQREMRQWNRSELDLRRSTAIHDAGHVTVAARLGVTVQFATIEPRDPTRARGFMLFGGPLRPDVDPDAYLRAEVRERVKAEDLPGVLLLSAAGEAAQECLEPDDRDGGADDRAKAFRLLAESLELSEDDPVMLRIWQRLLRPLAAALVKTEWRTIERVAAELLLRGRLDQDALRTLLQQEDRC